ncbi:MAG: lytic transglycosylase domain-containing protein, partial [Deltaproteobacteria bacterium]|nr:lytic transglycosylase domain-containing protein [Deltaproteobacteria bacterium]
ESYWPLIYPRAYDWAVSDYATQRGVRQELVWAIMYNESRFQPHVVSPANAIGLMQIVPRTGFEIAQAMGETGFAPDDLYDPMTNIRYGTWYLRAMLDRFEGNEICAMASYNAGPDVVSKWWRNKGSFSEEIFIEEIPYKETNNYVKQVLLTYRIYQYLYGG